MQIVTPFLCLLICGFGLYATATAADEGRLSLPASPGSGITYMIEEWPSGRSSTDAFKVYVGAAEQCCDGKTPISGSYQMDGGQVTFTPTFAFLEGQPYTVATSKGALSEFTIAPLALHPAPEVLAIYPSGRTLPENTLRFYIQFSAPMQPHQAASFVALIDPNGVEDRAAFMSFKQELWNADRTRLTLLMDPGRIKRGVAQNLRLGPALLEGQHYAISVAEGWPAANGRSAADRFDRTFVVSPPLRSLPTTDNWRIALPKSGSLDPVAITFDRPFDRFQTPNSLSLRSVDGAVVPGEVRLDDGETVWRFTPHASWRAGTYELHVDARLEDVAGNNFRDTLDHALGTGTRDVDRITVPLVIGE